MTGERRTLRGRYAHGLRAAIRLNAQAFAFSIMITSTFGVISAVRGSPDLGDVYAFMVGAILGFVAVLAVASRGFREAAMDEEPTKVLVVAAALSLSSAATALGAATLVAYVLDGFLAWGLAPFAASAAFLLVVGLEFGIAEKLES